MTLYLTFIILSPAPLTGDQEVAGLTPAGMWDFQNFLHFSSFLASK